VITQSIQKGLIMILHEKAEKDFNTASNYTKFPCICDYCGKEFMRHKRTIIQCNKTVSKDSCGVGECKKTKSDEVQTILYGMKNVGGTPESMKKKKKTCEILYGNEIYQRSEEGKKRSNEKWGTD
jgi:hypothetical protein